MHRRIPPRRAATSSRRLLGAAVLLTLTACGAPPDDGGPQVDDGDAAGPARIQVELVAPGSVSSELPEFAAALSPGGDTLWFNRTASDFGDIRLLWSTWGAEGWSEAVPFPPTEGFTAWDPFLDHLGRLWFTSDLPRPDGSSGDLDLWYLEREGDGWSEPRLAAAPLNSDSAEVFNSMTRDGLMVVASYRDDGVRRIWATRQEGEGWGEATALELGVGPEASNPAIAPDGSFLILSVPVDGAPDLVAWCRTGSGWQRAPAVPSPINSPWADFAPAILGDWLWFTSDRPGVVGEQPDSVRPPGDLYRAPLDPVRSLCEEGGAAPPPP